MPKYTILSESVIIKEGLKKSLEEGFKRVSYYSELPIKNNFQYRIIWVNKNQGTPLLNQKKRGPYVFIDGVWLRHLINMTC